ncbi:MAG: DUF1446 domain-containing protein [Halieaceae bacterium]|nr:DUF1446 domain-containing protein [Halieaceae bacterium]
MANNSTRDSNIIRIANCSGFYGDRLSAAREMVEGGPIDVLTGDYLAELTMSILYSKKSQNPNVGFVGTFLKQVKEVLGTCMENNVKIVSNAGGLNPRAMAESIQAIAEEAGLVVNVAYVDGDDLLPRIADLKAAGVELVNLDTGVALADSGHDVVTANAYLGAWGIKEALDAGADVVIAARVTDAAVVIGPAAWKFNWQRDDYDALAGALAAGHIIECGTQATGGNYSFFQEVPTFTKIGFPLAEIEADGAFTITKHPGTGGIVNTGTVTAQLLYEIGQPAYLNPDVIGHFDTMTIDDQGNDRVRVSGTRGSSPTPTHKVCINLFGGFKSSIDILLTGLDIEAKARVFSDALFELVGGRDSFDEVTEQLIRSDKIDPITNEQAFASLRVTVKSTDQGKVGRLFSAKVVELALSNIPGYSARPGGAPGSPFMIHWPALIDGQHITESVTMNGTVTEVQPTSQLQLEPVIHQVAAVDVEPPVTGSTVQIPLGRLFGTRSGDKGGNANLGVWAKTDASYSFLFHFLTVEKLKELLPDTAEFAIERYEMANIKALNFYIKGILGDGVAASSRVDGQAKSLGEYLRAKLIDVPEQLANDIED